MYLFKSSSPMNGHPSRTSWGSCKKVSNPSIYSQSSCCVFICETNNSRLFKWCSMFTYHYFLTLFLEICVSWAFVFLLVVFYCQLYKISTFANSVFMNFHWLLTFSILVCPIWMLNRHWEQSLLNQTTLGGLSWFIIKII